MIRYFILSCFLLQGISGFGQNTIRGMVVDAETKEPLAGASVYIPDLKTGGSADTSGKFIIRNIPAGTFLAEIRYTGYASVAMRLTSSASEEFPVISLLKTPTENPVVVVTGVSGSTERALNPVPTEMESREHLLTNAAPNLVAGISNLPGMSSVSTGNGISKPVIRGLGFNRVVVLRNGIRQEGQQWGDEHGIELDEYEVDRVEIIKGPGSIMYGSDAMAGVVNFLTPEPVEDGRLTGEAMVNYQTNGNLFGSSVMQAGNVRGVSWQARASQKKSGNFSTPADGRVLNSGFEEYNGSGYLGINRRWGYSRLSFSTFNQSVAIPEGERDSLGNFTGFYILNDSTTAERSYAQDELGGYRSSVGFPRQQIGHHRAVLSNGFFFGSHKLTTDFSFQQNRRREYSDPLAPGDAELDFILNTFNGNVNYFFPEKNNVQLSVGLSNQVQSSRNSGEEFLIPAYDLVDIGGFVYLQALRGKWFVNGGLRADSRMLSAHGLYLDSLGRPVDDPSGELKFDAFSRNFFAVSGSLGTSYRVSEETVLRVNVSKGFRAPNLAELGANGVHEGTFRYEDGNADLRPEKSLQADVGMTYTSDHFTLDVSGFYNNIQDFIYLHKLTGVSGGDSIPDPADPAPAFTFVQGHAALYGGEIATDLHPHPLDWLHFENSFSYVRGMQFNQPDSMSNLPFIPPARFRSDLNAELKAHGIFQDAYVKLGGTYVFPQDLIYSAFGTETPTPGYFLLEAGTGTDFVNKEKKVVLRVFISANNLLNTNYRNHLSRLKYAPDGGISNPGRNFSVRVVVPVNFK